MDFTAKTVEEAIALGLKTLELEESQVDITVKEQPTKGLFGIAKGKAVVEITRKKEKNDKLVDFLQTILDLMDANAKVKMEEKQNENDNTVLTIIADNSSELIGHRGEVLDAIQTLAGAYANIDNKEYKKVVVDCENYRDKREDTLIKLAKRLEAKAVELRREVKLEAMNPFERRIIHTALADSQLVKTTSLGKEPNRYVVIVPNDKDEYSTPYDAGRSNDKGKGKKSYNQKGRRNGYKSEKSYGSSNKPAKKRDSFVFGTYLGNSLKDKE